MLRVLLRLKAGETLGIRLISGDNYLVFREFFYGGQADLYLFVLLGFDGDHLFHPVVMQSQALDGHVVFAGGNLGDGDILIIVCIKYLVNDAGAGSVATVKNDQYGVLLGGGIGRGYVAEFHFQATFCADLGSAGLGLGLGVCASIPSYGCKTAEEA